LADAEVTGKPKEWSLTKAWSLLKKGKDILLFLKFLK